jgi:polar amino acid transport system substrate-binding protein
VTAFFRLGVCVLGFFFLIFPVSCFSESLKFISLEVAPWSYSSEKNERYKGVFPDVVKEIERRTGHHIEITMTSFSFERIDRELKLGRQDCAIVIEDEVRNEYVILGETLFEHSMGVIARRGLILHEYSDLYGYVISTNKKITISDKFVADKKIKKVFDVDYRIGLRKIKHGRIDAVAGAIPTIEYLANQEGMSDLLGDPLILKMQPVSLQCSKNSKKIRFMDSINQAIKSMKKDGTLSKIMASNF